MRRKLIISGWMMTIALITSALIGTPTQALPRPITAAAASSVVSRAAAHGNVRSMLRPDGNGLSTHRRPGPHSLRPGATSSVPGATAVALDSSSRTLYVAGTSSISVIDARRCTARHQHCQAPVATMPGVTSAGVPVVDPATHTLYLTDLVANGRGALLVYDTTRCNATVQTGCRQAPARLPLADLPYGVALDSATHTLYVSHLVNQVDVIDTHSCSARRPAGCVAPLDVISVDSVPGFPTVDHATRTLYLPTVSQNDGTTLWVIDISRCRAGSTSDCHDAPHLASVGSSPAVAEVVPAVDTVYVTNQGDSSISVLPYSTCNARNFSGCPTSTPPSAPTGLYASLMAYDAPSHTLFVDLQGSDALAAVNTRTCNAHHTSGCAKRAPALQTGGGPYWMILDSRTRTLYSADYVDGVLEVLDPRTCNATRTNGCRHEAPSFAGLHDTSVIDTRRHTYYQADADGALLLTDTRRCRVGRVAACAAATVRAQLPGQPSSLAVDLSTHTLYVTDNSTHQISAIDAATCNVTRHDDCTARARVTIPGGNLIFPHVNQRTHTVYIGQDDQHIAVVRGAHCNAVDQSGCSGDVTRVDIGGDPNTVDVDEATNTVYVTRPFDGSDAITLLPGAACDAGTAACAPIATTKGGSGPFATAIDRSTKTMYVSDLAYYGPGASVSVINLRTCRVGNTTGCSTTWPSFPAAPTVFGIGVIRPSRTLMTQNIYDSTVTVVKLAHCRATDQSGCPKRPTRIAVGYAPVVAFSNPETDTVFIFNPVDATTSLLDLRHPCRTHLCFR